MERESLTQRSFRDVLGRFGTGVVLVTACTGTAAGAAGGPGWAGMAANSFTSVSLDPPLIGLCTAHSSTTWPVIRAVGGFAVTILSDRHEQVCRTFATPGAERFGGQDWEFTPAGHPVLADGLGWLDCTIETVHPEGDHDLVIARADRWVSAPFGRPLIFHSGRYTRLAT